MSRVFKKQPGYTLKLTPSGKMRWVKVLDDSYLTDQLIEQDFHSANQGTVITNGDIQGLEKVHADNIMINAGEGFVEIGGRVSCKSLTVTSDYSFDSESSGIELEDIDARGEIEIYNSSARSVEIGNLHLSNSYVDSVVGDGYIKADNSKISKSRVFDVLISRNSIVKDSTIEGRVFLSPGRSGEASKFINTNKGGTGILALNGSEMKNSNFDVGDNSIFVCDRTSINNVDITLAEGKSMGVATPSDIDHLNLKDAPFLITEGMIDDTVGVITGDGRSSFIYHQAIPQGDGTATVQSTYFMWSGNNMFTTDILQEEVARHLEKHKSNFMPCNDSASKRMNDFNKRLHI